MELTLRLRCLLAMAIMVALAAPLLAGRTGAASNATPPVISPVVPDPAGCTVAPRSMQDLEALVAAAAEPAESVLGPTAVTIPLGQPVDDANVAEITDVITTSLACFNAGDFRRVLSLATDDAVRGLAARGILTAESLPFLAAAPQVLPPDQRIALVAVTDVTLLPDGRVGAFGVQIDPTSPPDGVDIDYVVLKRIDDTWRIDQTVDSWWIDPTIAERAECAIPELCREWTIVGSTT
jgi:hypothetical protein